MDVRILLPAVARELLHVDAHGGDRGAHLARLAQRDLVQQRCFAVELVCRSEGRRPAGRGRPRPAREQQRDATAEVGTAPRGFRHALERVEAGDEAEVAHEARRSLAGVRARGDVVEARAGPERQRPERGLVVEVRLVAGVIGELVRQDHRAGGRACAGVREAGGDGRRPLEAARLEQVVDQQQLLRGAVVEPGSARLHRDRLVAAAEHPEGPCGSGDVRRVRPRQAGGGLVPGQRALGEATGRERTGGLELVGEAEPCVGFPGPGDGTAGHRAAQPGERRERARDAIRTRKSLPGAVPTSVLARKPGPALELILAEQPQRRGVAGARTRGSRALGGDDVIPWKDVASLEREQVELGKAATGRPSAQKEREGDAVRVVRGDRFRSGGRVRERVGELDRGGQVVHPTGLAGGRPARGDPVEDPVDMREVERVGDAGDVDLVGVGHRRELVNRLGVVEQSDEPPGPAGPERCDRGGAKRPPQRPDVGPARRGRERAPRGERRHEREVLPRARGARTGREWRAERRAPRQAGRRALGQEGHREQPDDHHDQQGIQHPCHTALHCGPTISPAVGMCPGRGERRGAKSCPAHRFSVTVPVSTFAAPDGGVTVTRSFSFSDRRRFSALRPLLVSETLSVAAASTLASS